MAHGVHDDVAAQRGRILTKMCSAIYSSGEPDIRTSSGYIRGYGLVELRCPSGHWQEYDIDEKDGRAALYAACKGDPRPLFENICNFLRAAARLDEGAENDVSD